MIASIKLAIRYAIFAVIATAANIAAQEAAIQTYEGPYAILVAMMAGTVLGLMVKYLLDKRFIFRFKTRNAKHDGKTFILYTLMGLFTTVLFWGVELGFSYFYKTKEMRYLGGVIGLAIGYISKYQLDKRFVFRARRT